MLWRRSFNCLHYYGESLLNLRAMIIGRIIPVFRCCGQSMADQWEFISGRSCICDIFVVDFYVIYKFRNGKCYHTYICITIYGMIYG